MSLSHAHRRGTVYVAVLGVTLVVGVMAAAAMAIARLELRVATAHRQQEEARLLALSAVDFGVNWINRNSAWRALLTNDVEIFPFSLGGGAFTVKVVDADGSLTDDQTEAVTLVGYGRVGEAVAVDSVVLEPSGPGITSLEAALHCDGDVILDAGGLLGLDPTDVATNQTISSNNNIYATASNAQILGNAEGANSVNGSVIGVATGGVPVRQMPGAHVFDYYKNNGTWIDVNALPQAVLGPPQIITQVLSPGNNPFGTELNAEGIYVIDCQGQEIRIRDSRIVGTLVLLNNAPSSHTLSALNWEPAAANFPALLTENGFEFRHGGGSLNEGLLANFNPAHTPYNGVWNNTTLDSYPSIIRGLVYVGGLMRIDGATPRFEGAVVCEQISVASAAQFNYRDTSFLNPPPGFGAGPQMRIISGSWQRTSAD